MKGALDVSRLVDGHGSVGFGGGRAWEIGEVDDGICIVFGVGGAFDGLRAIGGDQSPACLVPVGDGQDAEFEFLDKTLDGGVKGGAGLGWVCGADHGGIGIEDEQGRGERGYVAAEAVKTGGGARWVGTIPEDEAAGVRANGEVGGYGGCDGAGGGTDGRGSMRGGWGDGRDGGQHVREHEANTGQQKGLVDFGLDQENAGDGGLAIEEGDAPGYAEGKLLGPQRLADIGAGGNDVACGPA